MPLSNAPRTRSQEAGRDDKSWDSASTMKLDYLEEDTAASCGQLNTLLTHHSRSSRCCAIHHHLVPPSTRKMRIQEHHQDSRKRLQSDRRNRCLLLLPTRQLYRRRLEIRQQRPRQRMQVDNRNQQTRRRRRWPWPRLRHCSMLPSCLRCLTRHAKVEE